MTVSPAKLTALRTSPTLASVELLVRAMLDTVLTVYAPFSKPSAISTRLFFCDNIQIMSFLLDKDGDSDEVDRAISSPRRRGWLDDYIMNVWMKSIRLKI